MATSGTHVSSPSSKDANERSLKCLAKDEQLPNIGRGDCRLCLIQGIRCDEQVRRVGVT